MLARSMNEEIIEKLKPLFIFDFYYPSTLRDVPYQTYRGETFRVYERIGNSR